VKTCGNTRLLKLKSAIWKSLLQGAPGWQRSRRPSLKATFSQTLWCKPTSGLCALIRLCWRKSQIPFSNERTNKTKPNLTQTKNTTTQPTNSTNQTKNKNKPKQAKQQNNTTNQPTNQRTNQPTNQPTNQRTNPTTNKQGSNQNQKNPTHPHPHKKTMTQIARSKSRLELVRAHVKTRGNTRILKLKSGTKVNGTRVWRSDKQHVMHTLSREDRSKSKTQLTTKRNELSTTLE